MEFKIYNPQEEGFLKEIDWNYEELKTEIQGKANDYMNLVYTADQVKDAKKDRANLNKFVEALESKRKEIKKQITEPYSAFEKQEKELVGIVNKAIANITPTSALRSHTKSRTFLIEVAVMKIAFYCRVDGQGFGFVLPDEADKLREFFAEHQDKPALENPSSAS